MAGLRVFDLEGFCVVATFGSPIARVAYDVLSRAGEDGTVRATHQQIADRLGAGRLVVSRALRELERSGAVSMRRGRIVIESRDLLKKFTLF
jgi:CRP/FNR family transcriptional regulator